jgi:hypothetical protein
MGKTTLSAVEHRRSAPGDWEISASTMTEGTSKRRKLLVKRPVVVMPEPTSQIDVTVAISSGQKADIAAAGELMLL